ncbi:MAG: hypothetical protein MUF50_02775 [Planctomycetes bacterium]|jgi:hypothetical protein|nr:hypothetical protein [Planctomycetota bacterium]
MKREEGFLRGYTVAFLIAMCNEAKNLLASDSKVFVKCEKKLYDLTDEIGTIMMHLVRVAYVGYCDKGLLLHPKEGECSVKGKKGLFEKKQFCPVKAEMLKIILSVEQTISLLPEKI